MGAEELERPAEILLIENNPGDVKLMKEAFMEARLKDELRVVTSGEEALDYLHRRDEFEKAPRPNIALLESRLSDVNGWELLERIKTSSELKHIPVIVLTSSEVEDDIVKSYSRYANAYLTKPVDGDEFVALARTIGEFWIRLVELPSTRD